MLDRRRLEPKVDDPHATSNDAYFAADASSTALATTSKVWHVSIGKPGVFGKVTDLEIFLIPVCRDGQKRPVYIYRFLTAGTIDGV